MRVKVFCIMLGLALLAAGPALAFDSGPPSQTHKLVFIHHSTGENWLQDEYGNLGHYLSDSNYFVSDTNYGWGPESIGDLTDLGHWWLWFRGENRDTIMNAVYNLSEQNSWYSRRDQDPGGENQVIMFKSCFPNSDMKGWPDEPATVGENWLAGQDAYSEWHTVANAKGIYNSILEYFASRQDKFFVAVTAPPLSPDNTSPEHADNIRAFNNWLVYEWLAGYEHHNVMVFDFYNVLTSNGGDPDTYDYWSDSGNHHRVWASSIQHIQTHGSNYAAYPAYEGDDHPSPAGSQKATEEFVPLLNAYVNCWRGSAECPPRMVRQARPGGSPR